MTQEKTVSQETVEKALSSLQELAKGHSSGSAPSTKVDSMRDASVGAGSDAGSTQIHHTPANSDPGGWAGSRAQAEGEDGAHDSVSENGTDYNGVSHGLMKSIYDKLAKGQPLSEAEQFVLKSAMAKGGMPFGKDDDKDDDKAEKGGKPFGKDDDEEDVGKSLADHADEHDDVKKGLELSPFLAGWAEVQVASAQSLEENIVNRIHKSLARIDDENSKFNTTLAKSIHSLAEVMAAQGQRLAQLESAPARGPKSATTPEPVEKSFGAGGQAATEQLEKSVVIGTMLDMVHKGILPGHEVVRFESTNTMSDELYSRVLAHHNSR